MAVLTNNFDAGTEGATITAGNSSSSGTAFLSVQGTPTYASAAALHGAKGMQITGGASTDQSFKWNAGGATQIDGRVGFVVSGTNSGEYTLVRGLTQTSPALAWRIRVGSSSANRKIRLTDSSGTDWFTSTADAPLDTTLRVEYHLISGTGNATLELSYFLGDSTTPVQSYSTTTGTLAPAGGFGDVQVGQWGSGNYSGGVKIDDVLLRTGVDSTGLPGPYSNIAPSVTMPSNQTVSASASVSLTATDSDSDGTISTRAWSFVYPTSGAPTLSGASTATATFTAGSAGSLYILQYTATDNGGASTSGTVEVRVPSTATTITTLPARAGTGDSGWSVVGGSSTEGDALGDSNSSTGVDSPAMTGTQSKRRWRLAPMAARTSFSFSVDGYLTAVGSHTSLIRLYSGSTLIKEASLPYTGSTATYTTTLTSGEVASITDWGALYVEEVAVL